MKILQSLIKLSKNKLGSIKNRPVAKKRNITRNVSNSEKSGTIITHVKLFSVIYSLKVFRSLRFDDNFVLKYTYKFAYTLVY